MGEDLSNLGVCVFALSLCLARVTGVTGDTGDRGLEDLDEAVRE